MLRARAELLKMESNITDELKKMPENSIYIAKNRKNFNWYTILSGKRKYIPRKERRQAEKLARKKMLQARKKDVQRELESINNYLKIMEGEDLEWNRMIDYFNGTGLLQEKECKMEETIQKWMEEDYVRNPNHPENLTHFVYGNLWVRSKSEQAIALQLHKLGIPFRYECELIIDGVKYYPDFTIMHPKTGKIYYWEHLGAMDDPGYIKRTYEKLKIFKETGIIFGDNLILTTESKENWFNPVFAASVVSHFFGYYS